MSPTSTKPAILNPQAQVADGRLTCPPSQADT